MDLNQSISPSPQVISQEVAGETVLLDLESESYFGLDAVGTRIWQLINEEGNLQEIYNRLLEEYEVEEAQLRSDLENLLNHARDHGLITLGASGGKATP